ncbi:UNVERIFIED_CONTAM: hypothetical protein K2H54_007348 [Gekko kuhli]
MKYICSESQIQAADMEAWYQPYTEIDSSHPPAALGRGLGQTSRAFDLMEFPTMEGGLITPSDESRRHPGDESRSLHASNVTHTPLLGMFGSA